MSRRKVAFCFGITSLALALAGCPIAASSDLGSASAGSAADSAANDAAADAAQNSGNPANRDGTGPSADSGATGGSDSSVSASDTASFSDCLLPGQESQWKDRILQLVNEERGKAGVGALTRNATLEAEAEQYACEMIHYNFFDHVNPVTHSTLGIRARVFGYDYAVVGENLAAGQTSPEQAFHDWMNSASHRQNILDPRFVELGVGVRAGGDYGLYWVQEFGDPVR